MTYEECKAWIDDNLDGLLREYGVPHWQVVIDYKRIPDPDGDEHNVTHMRVSTYPDYERASIEVDFEVIPNVQMLEVDLRHEICHIVHSPVDWLVQAVWPYVLKGGPEAEASVRNTLRSVGELLVKNLERMSFGHRDRENDDGTRTPSQFPQPEWTTRGNDHEDDGA